MRDGSLIRNGEVVDVADPRQRSERSLDVAPLCGNESWQCAGQKVPHRHARRRGARADRDAQQDVRSLFPFATGRTREDLPDCLG